MKEKSGLCELGIGALEAAPLDIIPAQQERIIDSKLPDVSTVPWVSYVVKKSLANPHKPSLPPLYWLLTSECI